MAAEWAWNTSLYDTMTGSALGAGDVIIVGLLVYVLHVLLETVQRVMATGVLLLHCFR